MYVFGNSDNAKNVNHAKQNKSSDAKIPINIDNNYYAKLIENECCPIFYLIGFIFVKCNAGIFL